MHIKYSIKTAYNGLASNKPRSILTILGIVIGITAIILIVSMGQGAQNLILSQIQGLGSKTIVVIPGREPKGPSDAAQVFSDSLKEKDLTALKIKSNVPTLGSIMPLLFGGEAISYQDEIYRATVFGGSELISDIFDLDADIGRFFTQEEVRSRADVAIIGSKVKEELFGPSDALGEKIKIKNKYYKIIGILPRKGQVSFFNFDETAIVPYTTAQQYIFGIKYFHRFVVTAQSEDLINQTVRDIQITLRNEHQIEDPSKDDFFVETQADLASRLGVITSVLTLFLVSVAAISLLVGGIGIMNIMLVSVTERTREIGLRKAIGATEKNILQQFLFEAIMLTASGGAVGIALGTILSYLVSLILGGSLGLAWEFSFPFVAAIIGLAVSSIVGLIFGLYPARKASLKSPIEALRYE